MTTRAYNIRLDRKAVIAPPLAGDDPGPRPPVFPTVVDWRRGLPVCWDQGSVGASASYAVCAVIQHQTDLGKPSPWFLDYNQRMLMGDFRPEASCCISDAMNALVQYGVCGEKQYGASESGRPPGWDAYASSPLRFTYQHIRQELHPIRATLAMGRLVVLSIQVYDSFDSHKVGATGLVPIPRRCEALLGGTALVLVGFNDHTRCFTARNSFGPQWGDQGYAYLPYEYVLDPGLASDLWIIRQKK